MNNNSQQPVFINISLGTIFKAFFAIFLAYAIFMLRDLVLILITSVVLASAIEPAALWLMAKRIPRTISVLLIYAAIITFLATTFYFFAPPFVNDLQSFVKSLPQYVTSVNETEGVSQLTTIPTINQFLESLKNIEQNEIISALNGAVPNTGAGLVSTISLIFGGIFSMIMIFVFSFYLAVQEDGINSLIRIITPIKHEKYVIDLWKRSQKKIGYWVQGQLLLSVFVGVLTYLGLTIVGIQNALMLAVITGLFELIPIFGSILAAIPAVAFAFTDGGISLSLIVLGVYVIIQQFESQLIHPLVVQKIVGIPALIAILALIIGGQIAGFLGVLIAVPVAAAIMEYINDIELRRRQELQSSQN
jgi:predicted PurR-regulated permease PerM